MYLWVEVPAAQSDSITVSVYIQNGHTDSDAAVTHASRNRSCAFSRSMLHNSALCLSRLQARSRALRRRDTAAKAATAASTSTATTTPMIIGRGRAAPEVDLLSSDAGVAGVLGLVPDGSERLRANNSMEFVVFVAFDTVVAVVTFVEFVTFGDFAEVVVGVLMFDTGRSSSSSCVQYLKADVEG